MRQFGKNLKDNESLIQQVHQHLVVLSWPMLVGTTLILVPIFLLYPLFGLGRTGIAIFVLMILFGVLLISRAFILWYGNFTLLTNQRIIFFSKKRLFDKKVFDIELDAIEDIILHTQGLLGTALGYDNLKLIVIRKNTTKKKWLYCIPDAPKFREKALELIHEIKESKQPTFYTAEDLLEKTRMTELFKVMREVRDRMGDERFAETLDNIKTKNK